MTQDAKKAEPTPAESPALPVTELEELRKKAAQADEYLDLAKRTKADFINYPFGKYRHLNDSKIRGLEGWRVGGRISLTMTFQPATSHFILLSLSVIL